MIFNNKMIDILEDFFENRGHGERDEDVEDGIKDPDTADEDQAELLMRSINLTPDSDLFIISVDSKPICYVKDEDYARKKIKEIASKMSLGYIFEYSVDLENISDSEIHIRGIYKNYLLAYEKILHSVSYSKACESV